MKGSEEFQKTIGRYLSDRAAVDPLFSERFRNPGKNLGDCVTFILNEVQKSGINGFTDDEIYSLALHYYMEENIDPGKDIQCQVIVNHQVQLTEEEIREMKDKARQEVFSQECNRLRNAGRFAPAKTQETEQLTLF